MCKAAGLVIVIAVAIHMALPETAAQQANPSSRNESTASREVIRLRSDETLFNPNYKKALSYRDGGVVLSLVNGKKSLAVDIQGPSQPSQRVELPSEMVQVNEIMAIPAGKAVVVGMVNGSAFEIVILDTRSVRIADTFLAYAAAVSPDGRFITFVKFYPAHFVEGTDDHYLLYDVSRSAVENRPANGSLSDRTNVGIPVYPYVANKDGDNTGIPERQRHHMMAQTFFWRSDSVQYAFADEHAAGWSVLIVSLADGGMPRVTRIVVEKNELCAALRKQDCQVTLTEAELTSLGLLAKFRGVAEDSALEQVVRYPYEQFSPIR